jgi:hypothetical protein
MRQRKKKESKVGFGNHITMLIVSQLTQRWQDSNHPTSFEHVSHGRYKLSKGAIK